MFKAKLFWDRVEIWAALLGATFAAITSAVPPDIKPWTATPVAFFLLIVAISKHRSKSIDEQSKLCEAAEKAETQRKHQEQVARLEQERDNLSRKAVAAISGVLWRRYFGNLPNQDHYKNRVTVFRKELCDEPTRFRLVIFARFGRYSDSISSWPIDDNEPSNCRGVAGKIYARNTLERFIAPHDWPDDGNPISRRSFADALNATVDETESLKVKSKAFIGTTIVVNGAKWGVLLLDSCDSGHIKDSKTSDEMVKRYANIIGEVMGEVGS
jgi:hypothetical protein